MVGGKFLELSRDLVRRPIARSGSGILLLVSGTGKGDRPPEFIEFYSPLVANQILNDPGGPGTRKEVWSIVVNAGEIRDVAYRDVRNGSFLPWKVAFWGVGEDQRLLKSITRLPTLAALEKAGALILSEGMQVRTGTAETATAKGLDPHPELAGRYQLKVKPLARRRFLFRFPTDALKPLPIEQTYVRKGRFPLPMSVCEPPHIIASAARNFAVYSDDFIIVPPRQIGIAATWERAGLLKALALYLNSDFVKYHQFLTTPQLGIKREVATLHSLKALPVPFRPDEDNWAAWDLLYERLRRAEQAATERGQSDWYAEGAGAALFAELNALVNKALGLDLDHAARAAVHDLVHVRRALVDGQVGRAAIRPPEPPELRAYAAMLGEELDAFLGEDIPARHKLTIIFDTSSAMAEVELIRGTVQTQRIAVEAASSALGAEFRSIRARLREQRSQWIYFERSLLIYEESRTYLFKPMQRVHWTESQALADASGIIADTLQPISSQEAGSEIHAW